MGGVFGVIGYNDCVMDVFFGTDYHSHLGTKRGGMCIRQLNGFNRKIHDIENSPFRSKFEEELDGMRGTAGIGAISDSDPQPLIMYNKFGHWGVTTVGRINNKDEIVKKLIDRGHLQFLTMSGNRINNTEVVAAIVSTGRDIVDGIQKAQDMIEGSVTMLILTEREIYAARDKVGRTPLILGMKKDGYCVASESFAFINIGYQYLRELGPGEIVVLNEDGERTLVSPNKTCRFCAFLWTYFGYTTSVYEGKNVEKVRQRNGALLAKRDGRVDVDYVAGVPDSGIAHALGYANESNAPYARPLIKYTTTWPRSFMPQNQRARNLIAKMKLVPVFSIIKDKKFILIDDSIVRGTQLTETVAYLIDNGAKQIHVRSACPPIMYGCKFLNFARTVNEQELITRRMVKKLEGIPAEEDVPEDLLAKYADEESPQHAAMVEAIREKMQFDSLAFQKLDDLIEATRIDRSKLCTYCWNGKE